VLGVSWCSGHCAVGGALVAAAAGTAAVAGHRPFQQSEARTRSWAVGVELLASDGLPIAWPVGSMERAWAVSAWSSDGTRLVCSRQDAVTERRSICPKSCRCMSPFSFPKEIPGWSVTSPSRPDTHPQAPERRAREALTHTWAAYTRGDAEYSGKLHHDTTFMTTFHLSGVALPARASV
jgi:hypothetical protein